MAEKKKRRSLNTFVILLVVLLAVSIVILAGLSLTIGLVLDTVAKSHRKQWEIDVYQAYSR